MPSSVDERLQWLRTLNSAALVKEWKTAFGKPPAASLRRDLMIPILIHRDQQNENGNGNRSRDVSQRLKQASDLTHTRRQPPSSDHIQQGTRLIREWRGQTHTVQVAENGFLYKDHRYESLSEIASLITGTHWSGPRFFGLRPRRSEDQRNFKPVGKQNGKQASARPSRRFAVRFIRASRQKKVLSNPSTHCMHSAKLAKPTSSAKDTKAGK
ncbi:MAG TPA: DUF2924 domain-containing protein [Terriglobales bacterium]